ncbi:staphylococcal-like nuclease CAN2 [Tanacetum coccineum]|uniref:Staphylococcal-like nuclease CAN2 n=1 Tax=Tanacetum coccineum TaxID=301880 RepID=A0ABQ5CRL7_9ASTR
MLVNLGSVPFGWEQSPRVNKDLAPNVINIEKNVSLSSRDDNDHHHESDIHEAYMDALDTLSRESKEESADDSDFDLKILANKSSKFCGLTPRGFCFANRVRGMCMETRLPISPAGNKSLLTYLALLLLVLSVDPKMRGDAPERSIPFGKEAKDELVKMIDGKSLKIIIFRKD